MENVLLIGIAGGSGSGKTTLARRIVENFGDDVTVIRHDNYYKRHDELPFEKRCCLNYDEPGAFDTELLIGDLKASGPVPRWNARYMILPIITVRIKHFISNRSAL